MPHRTRLWTKCIRRPASLGITSTRQLHILRPQRFSNKFPVGNRVKEQGFSSSDSVIRTRSHPLESSKVTPDDFCGLSLRVTTTPRILPCFISCVPLFSKTPGPSCVTHLLAGGERPSSAFDAFAGGGGDDSLSIPSHSCISSDYLPSLPWALSVPLSLHCISFSSKNRSFNLGRTINWDEKKTNLKYGEAFQLLHQA